MSSGIDGVQNKIKETSPLAFTYSAILRAQFQYPAEFRK